jgi:hypothetical protein
MTDTDIQFAETDISVSVSAIYIGYPIYRSNPINIHKNQKVDIKSQTSSLAINFDFIKEFWKYPIRSVLLSFLTGESHQLNMDFMDFINLYTYLEFGYTASSLENTLWKKQPFINYMCSP